MGSEDEEHYHGVNIDEQVQKFINIANLYTNKRIRKAAFYQRYAALLLSSKPKQDWKQSYNLLLSSLDGYKLTLDPIEYQKRLNDRTIGWTGIHFYILYDLVNASLKMNCKKLAIRHLSFLLHSLFEILSPTVRAEFAKQLEALSSENEEYQEPIVLDNGFVVPVVNLTKFPTVTSFKVQNLFAALRPVRIKTKQRESFTSSAPPSPFIFTPLSIGRPSNRRKSSTSLTCQHMDFKWIQDETCQISLQVTNHLPIELQVKNMALITDGVKFETYPTSLTLPSESGPFPVQLTGTPRSSGKLEILGYVSEVLGIKSECRLADLPYAKKMKLANKFVVDVIPCLPILEISCPLLSKSDTFSSLSTEINAITSNVNLPIYAGQTVGCFIKLTNKSSNNELIEIISLKLSSKLPKNIESKLITWNEEDINDNLPLSPGKSFDFPIKVYGISNFLVDDAKKKIQKATKSTSASRTASPAPNHYLYNSPVHHSDNQAKKHNILGTALAHFLSDLQVRSQSSKNKYTNSVSEPIVEYSTQLIEVILELEYSGGGGLASGYCRKCSLAMNIEISPSVIITRWDVLPAQIPSQCYLVFDVLNSTSHEMELKYSDNKSLLMESKETCRIPVPVERFPLINDDQQINKQSISETALQEYCQSQLVDQVNLKWILASDISGICSIADVPWSPPMLDAILMSSIQWEVLINGGPLEPEEELNFKMGELIQISMSLTNCCTNPLRSLQLTIFCFQDYKNGSKNYRMDAKRAVCGVDRLYIDQIDSKKAYNHQCGFVFFYSGLYKMEIQCTGYDSYFNDIKLTPGRRSNSNLLCTWKHSPCIELNISQC